MLTSFPENWKKLPGAVCLAADHAGIQAAFVSRPASALAAAIRACLTWPGFFDRSARA